MHHITLQGDFSMKLGFKLKALVAGALLLSGGSALANTSIDTSGGDIFLSLWDQTAGTTFVFDTGLNQSTFSSSGSYSFNLSSDANYTAFFNAVGSTGDTVTYNLIAVGTAGAYSTSGSAPTPRNSGLNQALSAGTNYATSVNGVSSSTTNSAYATGGNATASVWGSTDAGWTNQLKVSPSANAAVGTALNFYSVAFNGTNHTSNFILATVNQFASTWLLDSAGNLSYGAVPIPAPFGLLLGGLALMGVISRRKPASAGQDLGGAAA
jgi:hypothetical protein